MHGDINPVSDERGVQIVICDDARCVQGNILITEEGNACLGVFGVKSIINDPAVVEQGSAITPTPGVVRYMAPELLNPSQFGGSSKESDVYSLATSLEQPNSCDLDRVLLPVATQQRDSDMVAIWEPGTTMSRAVL